MLELGYSCKPATFVSPRPAPKERCAIPKKKSKTTMKFEDSHHEDTPTETVDHMSDSVVMEVTEEHVEKCQANESSVTSATTVCPNCCEKDRTILALKNKVLFLERKIKEKEKETMHEKLLNSDQKVQFYTGLPNLETFEALYESVEGKVQKMNYWRGPKYVSVRKIRTPLFFRSPKKFGPKRKLHIKDELLLVLMKLRLCLVHEDLADRFGVSIGTVSSVITTWVKVLCSALRKLIYWPPSDYIRAQLPSRIIPLYPKLRAIIDCTEIFIERPRELFNQSHTWSDYKKNNTGKILVAITPRGSFSFVSESFGGRSTDKYIVHKSGFLELIEPYDQIMADNGFPIQAELMLRGAELVKPPSARGFDQALRANVMSTKRVANIRIHVERAIQRLKTFRVLSGTYPISMISILDEVIIICAALCNIENMLVE